METKLDCARCEKRLKGGRGQFYVVRIDTICDPTPPEITAEDMAEDPARQMERLIKEIEGKSEQELIDQVYQRKFLCLCTPCYRLWIKDPVIRSKPHPRLDD